MTPKIDVIVPVYNAKKYLIKCIRSIQKQTIKDWKLILVDDGSTDGCAEICDRFAAEDIRITVLHQENRGLIGARMTGIANATSEFIVFVDADDLMEPEMLQKLLNIQVQHSADIVCCEYKILSRKGYIKRSCRKNQSTAAVTSGKEEAVRIASGIGTLAMWGKLYQRALFLEVLGGIESLPNIFYGEDSMINTLVFSKAKSVVHISDELYDYRIGGYSSKCSDKTMRELAELYRWRKQYLLSANADLKNHIINLDGILHSAIYLVFSSKKVLSREKVCTELAYPIADIDHICPNYKHKDAYDLNIPMTDKEFKNVYHESPLVVIKQKILRIF